MPVRSLMMSLEGLQASRIVWGAWRLVESRLTPDEIRRLMHVCIEHGITTIDHADIYGGYTAEGVWGEAMAQEKGLRDQLQLVTKCGIMLVSPNRPSTSVHHYDTSRAHIIASVENSLRELRTDYLDLLLIHRPDVLMNADETAAALRELFDAGKVLHFGVSNFSPSQYALLASRLDFPLVTNQVEFSVTHLDPLHDGTFDQCQQLRIAPMAWSPLGGGSLFRDNDERSVRLRDMMQRIGMELGGATLDQVALAWILTHPANVMPVIGTSKIERVIAAANAEQWRLSREQWFAIWQASTGHEVP
ncbi:MAG: aldo/keto reductase [Herpetosiphon sp.]|nr:aldo/keto reductase [Herpetosiphon sp.]